MFYVVSAVTSVYKDMAGVATYNILYFACLLLKIIKIKDKTALYLKLAYHFRFD